MSNKLEAQEHHFLSSQPPVLSSDAKIARKQLSLRRRELRLAKEERWLALARDVVRPIPQTLINETGDVLKAIFQAHGEAARGLFSNSDPLTWGGSAVFVSVYIAWLTLLANSVVFTRDAKGNPKDTLATVLQLDKLGKLPQSTAATVFNGFSSLVGVDQSGGTFGIQGLDGNGNVTATNWYSNTVSRDAAFFLLAGPFGVTGGNAIAALEWPGTVSFKKISRKFTQDGSFITYPAAEPPPIDTNAQAAINTWKQNVSPGGWYVVVAQTAAGNWIVVNSTMDITQSNALLNITYGDPIDKTKMLTFVTV